jgi:hypothetical protein
MPPGRTGGSYDGILFALFDQFDRSKSDFRICTGINFCA